MFDGCNFIDQPIKNHIKRLTTLEKLLQVNYTTGCLLGHDAKKTTSSLQ